MNATFCSRHRRLTVLALASFVLVSLLGACGGGGTPASRVARVEITPGGVLLTAMGDTHPLTVQAFDAGGQPVDGAVHWTSSAPQMVSVAADGTLTAEVELGSALVTATVNGVDSFPASVIIASPIDGAVLVPDTAIVETVSPLPAAVGDGLQTVIAGFENLAVGDVIIGNEGTPLLGRVTSLESAAGGTRVRYDGIPLQEAFDRVHLDLDFDLGSIEPQLVESLRGSMRVERLSEGRYAARSLHGGSSALKAPKCKGSASAAQISISQLSTTLTNELHFRVGMLADGEGGVAEAHAYVVGKLQQDVSASASANAGLNGTYSCTLELFSIPIPVDEGLITAVVHPVLPIGATVSVSGTLKSVSAQLGVKTSVGFTTKVGFGYDEAAGATVYHDFDPLDPTPDFSLATTTPKDFHVDLSAFGGLASGVSLELALTKQVSLIGAKLGVQQDVSLAQVSTQAKDKAYASNYGLSLVGNVAVGTDVAALMGWMGVSATYQLANLSYADPLAKSPRGTLSVSSTDLGVGQSEQMTIAFDPDTITYVTRPNIKEARFYVLHGDDEPVLVDTVETTASNQTTYTGTWNTTLFTTGDYTVVGFVVDEALSAIATFPLEVAADSGVLVHVTGMCTQTLGLRPLSNCAGGATSTTHTATDTTESTMTVTTTDIELEPMSIDPNSLNIVSAVVSLDWTQHNTASGCTDTAKVSGVRVTPESFTNYVTGSINYYPNGDGDAPAGSYMAWGAVQGIAMDVQHSCANAATWTSTSNFEAYLFATAQYVDRTVSPWPLVQQDDVINGEATVQIDQNGVRTTITNSWNFLVPGVRAPR